MTTELPHPRRIGAITLPPGAPAHDTHLASYIQLKLAALGQPMAPEVADSPIGDVATALLASHLEKNRLLAEHLCPVDQRIQDWLESYLAGADDAFTARLPSNTFVLDRHGLARLLSLPPDRDEHSSPLLSSYRLRQGILHNPRSDRRTTAGVFHVADGGLPIPADKLIVPRRTFARLFAIGLQAPADLLTLPYTATGRFPVTTWVSLLLRPVVAPAVPQISPEKRLEIRFFVPGSLVANLDFVESIFGNAGDPGLPENDAALDTDHWTGHSGCVILAPHLVGVTKQAVGLPHWDQASERQRRDGMCWKNPGDLYNDGQAFKVCARDERGVIVTLIADNYFGYCKKEVKTQISFSANLGGFAEEEHAGGTYAFPSYDLGTDFTWDTAMTHPPRTMEDVPVVLGHEARYHADGYAIDKLYPDIVYVPGDSRFDLESQTVKWTHEDGGERSLRLRPDDTYVLPWGYQVKMQRPAPGRAWRLVGTVAEARLCHKPCTVSGGGKSEISKPITDAIIYGPVFIADFDRDFDEVHALLTRDYANRFKPEHMKSGPSRPILSRERTLGSVIKLLTPSALEYTDEYNAWLRSIPPHIKELVFVVKRFNKPEWGADWRSHFGVDMINGVPGNELKLGRRKLLSAYLRVGYERDGRWRVFSLRKDFQPSFKIQAEDDITASVTIPARWLSTPLHSAVVTAFSHRRGVGGGHPDDPERSVKLVHNCEYRLFQRPDDAIVRGYDHQAEADISRPGAFLSNYEPLTRTQARELMADTIGFEQFTDPMRGLIAAAAQSPDGPAYFCSSHQPRLVDGKPSKNPRYLQTRPDLLIPLQVHLATVGMRLARRIPEGQPLYNPVHIVLPGRRNNPPEPNAKVPALCVHNPIHYFELPEFFIEVICSMTGRSPSTTGAGSEGALTKGPFNALPGIIDLNNAFVSMALTGTNPFITSAGCVGPHLRVDHDISLIVPEVFARMTPGERDPAYLIEGGFLERCGDFTHDGRTLPGHLLGWRITQRFVNAFFGRVFTTPDLVFTPDMLRPEEQDRNVFAEGLSTIEITVRRVAQLYFDDGSVDMACPPLRSLLHIMKDGHHGGVTLADPAFRSLFQRDAVVSSDWYAQRLRNRQAAEVALQEQHIRSLEAFLRRPSHAAEAERLKLSARLDRARARLDHARDAGYLDHLRGTTGLSPLRLPA